MLPRRVSTSDTHMPFVPGGAMGSLRSGVLIGGGISMAGKALSSSANLLMGLVLTRVAPVEEIGKFFLIQSILIFGAALVSQGVPQFLLQAAARGAAEYRDLDSSLVASCVSAVLVTSTVASLVYFAGDACFGWTNLLVGRSLDAWVIFAALVLFGLNGLLTELDRALGNIAKAVFLGGAVQAVVFIAAILVVFAVGGEASAATLLLLYLAAACVPVTVQLIGYAKILTVPVETSRIPEIWKLSAPFWGTNLLLSLMSQSQMWIIARWGGVGDVGIFGAVFKLSLVLSMMNIVFGGFMPPLVSKLYFSGDQERAEKILRTYATFSSAIVIGFCLTVAMSGERIVALLLGPQYVQGADLLLLLCLLHLANQLCGHRGVVFLMLGHERLLFKITIVAAICSLLGGALVMSQLGLYWYVSYVVAVGSVQALAEAHFARRVVGLRPYMDWRLLNPNAWVPRKT